ncbi:MAG TPA: galactosyltransferase-related protein [Pyrinomonadaceae bacterium]|nr:galactosyltransferase-related protein [Pyrinomonadaceae bacterium]
MRNRNEELLADKSESGVRCDWRWTTDLHITKVFPILGYKLMRRALADFPVKLASVRPHSTKAPFVSFIIGHRGIDRLPHLLTTLRSLASQEDAEVECIVVDQSITPAIETLLPSWVRYVHAPGHSSSLYCRASAFNVGAKRAAGQLFVLHDNDLLVPLGYAAHLVKRFNDGFEVINLKRFIFYLSADQTARVCSSISLNVDEPPSSIMQNALGGGSLALSREAYFSIGGFDESFIGWGGEDDEFWERALTRKVWQYAYMPLVHLWHPDQPEKANHARASITLLAQRSVIPVQKRIEELSARNFASVRAHE